MDLEKFNVDPLISADPDEGLSRRSFLKAAGFSFGGLVLAGCGRGPANEVFSSLEQPEEIVPGRAYRYASVCAACPAGCGVLVKDRDGRPLKLEGNPEHPISRGGLCAIGQASLLELYDTHRVGRPRISGKDASWKDVDDEIAAALGRIRRKAGAVRILAHSVTSPSLRAELEAFLAEFPGSALVVYDPLSASAILDAHQETRGVRALPRFHFDRAEAIVGFDADFLGTWISPVEFTAAYRAGRTLAGAESRMSRHIQFESRMSLTGANADSRFAVAPGDVPLVMAHLARELSRRAGSPSPAGALAPCPVETSVLRDAADALWIARGRSLVVCGLNEVPAQLLAASINQTLGNYGKTIDVESPSFQRQGDDRRVHGLLDELKRGKVDALFILGADPVAELPEPDAWEKALGAAPLVVSLSGRLDATTSLARYVCPVPHQLESWSDSEAVSGLVSLSQPTVRPLTEARQAMESLSIWSGRRREAYGIVREHWRKGVFARQGAEKSFDRFWDKAVHDGFALVSPARSRAAAFRPEALSGLGSRLGKRGAGLTLALYPKVSMLDGSHAHNPWLQELPDPVTKIVWDNYACLSPAAAKRMSVSEGDVVSLSAGGRSLALPAHIQPGQHDDVVAVALGYGRSGTERFAGVGPDWVQAKPTVKLGERVGRNASAMISFADGCCSYQLDGITLSKTGERRELACTQEYHSLEIPAHLAALPGETRPIVRETSLAEYQNDPSSGNEPDEHEAAALWPGHDSASGRRWGMVIDLGACTGCSACVVACQAENNVPVVGKDEVRRHREMHWMRIDRYYSGEETPDASVSFQPMLCQHCGNAPCETVCPVAATVHSGEGLNQQVYNRCVGTRYCANNCPYKVRRFNWFQYQREEVTPKLALNPDVVTRTRGVMEKCSLCVQRVQEAKFEAKRQGRALRDGEAATACEQSCPARAIVFGDLNDPASRVAKLKKDPRHYRVLAELNVRPSVGYMVKVRNRRAAAKERRHE